MKHSYQLDCPCPRCAKERARRLDQSTTDHRLHSGIYSRPTRRHLSKTDRMIERRERRLMELNDQGIDDNSDWS